MKRSACFRGIGRTILIATAALLLCAPPVLADDVSPWQATTGGTVDPNGNFVLGYEPNSIEGYALSGGTLAATNGTVGYWGIGVFYQSGGSAGFTDQLIFGHETSGIGTYMLEGGTLSLARGTLGLGGSGGFRQTGGRALVWDTLALGQEAGAIGRYSLEGGELLGARRLYIGYEGNGGFVQTGGMIDRLYVAPWAIPGGPYFDPELILGYAPGSTGTYELSGGYLRAQAGTIGYQGVGLYNQSGGSALFRDLLVLGHEASGTGEVELSGGTLTAGFISIGKGGFGSFTQTGGSCIIDPFITEHSGGPDTPAMVLGELSGGRGSYVLAGGWLGEISGGVPPPHPVVIGGAGEGLFRQTGGTHICRSNMTLGSLSGSSGMYVLDDGLLVQGSDPAAPFTACLIGGQGLGLFVQGGGTARFTGAVTLGGDGGGVGWYGLLQGTFSAKRLFAGGHEAVGGFFQLGGTATIQQDLILGAGLASRGTYDLLGGMLSAGGGTLGYDREAVGTFLQAGGTANFQQDLIIGANPGSTGVYVLTDGVLQARNASLGYSMSLYPSAVGSFSQSGGSVGCLENLILGHDGGTGRYELSGGTLSAGIVTLGHGHGYPPARGEFTQSEGIATFSDGLLVRNGTYQMSGGTLTGGETSVGGDSADGYLGVFDQSGGLAVFRGPRLAVGSGGAGGRGTYALSGGSLLAQTDALLDGSSRGVLLQSGGTATFEKDLALGLMVGHRGTYGLSGGLLSAVRGTVGYYGRGAFEQSGGSAAFSENLILGHEPGGTGTYALSGGSLVGASATIGQRGYGIYRQSDGWASFGRLTVGGTVGGAGLVELSGGQLYSGYMYVGHGGTGEFLQTGGTHQPGRLTLGGEGSGTGRYVLDDGLLRCESNGLFIGDAGRGEFIQIGGSVLTTGTKHGVRLGNQAGAEGTYVLSDGVLGLADGRSLVVGYYGTGRFVQTGGSAGYLAPISVPLFLRDTAILGDQPGSFGECILEGGQGPYFIVGREGTGHVVQTGGVAGGADVNHGLYELRGGTTGATLVADTFIQTGGVCSIRLFTLGGSTTGRYELHEGLLYGSGEIPPAHPQTIGAPGGAEFLQTGGSAMWSSNMALGRQISTSGTYRLTGGTVVVGTGGDDWPPEGMVVGGSGEGLWSQSGGSIRFRSALTLGQEPGGTGLYQITRGTLAGLSGTLGARGAGTFDQSDGGVSFRSVIIAGYDPSGTGAYVLSGGSLSTRTGMVGNRGIGIFDQSGGSAAFSENLILGYEPGSTGTYALSGGSLVATRATIGYRGVGEFHQTGGTGIIGYPLSLGVEPAGTGRFLMEDGLLRVRDDAFVGEGGLGEFIQTGGTVRVGTPPGNPQVGLVDRIDLGFQAGAKGSYVLQDGLLEIDYGLLVGGRGTGTLVQTGGTIRMMRRPSQGIVLGYEPGSFGEYLLTDGHAMGVYVGRGGSGHVLQTGGNAGGCGVNNGLYELQGGTTGLSTVRGTVIQTGGTNLARSEWGFQLGGSVGARYEMHGGTFLSYASQIGVAGGAEFVQTGGTCTVSSWHAAPIPTRHGLVLGEVANASGTYRLTGGSLAVGLPYYDNYWEGTLVGEKGTGLFLQTGGTFYTSALSVGGGSTSSGLYAMSGGELTTWYLRLTKYGEFLQTGGHIALDFAGVAGRYALTGGQLDANTLAVGNEFTLGRWGALSIGKNLYLGDPWSGQSAVFHAEPFSTIHMVGAGGSVGNYSTDPSGLADLAQVWMIFEGSGNDISLGKFEVAGKDLGPTPAGYQDNFALGVLELAGSGFGRVFALTDVFDNQPDWVDGEALYVDVLMIHQGVFLKPGALSLYYRNHGADVKRFFVADANLDGAVDGGDLALMNSHWWRPDGLATREEGDLNGDGWVDGGDIALLGGTWGAQTEDYIAPLLSPPVDQAVPEPATLLVLALGGAVGAVWRRKPGQ